MKDRETLGELNKVLKLLNEEVDATVKKRTDWMDAHMADYATVKVGEPIYRLSDGKRMGIVSRLYRYWGPDRNTGKCRNIEFDTSMSVEYEFELEHARNCFDNTSRQPAVYGPKDKVWA